MIRSHRSLTLALLVGFCLAGLPLKAATADSSSSGGFLAFSPANELCTAAQPARMSSTKETTKPEGSQSLDKASSVQIPNRIPDPTMLVIYETCGTFCSQDGCGGQAVLTSCVVESTGQPGSCYPRNAWCGEPQRSPCYCHPDF